MGITDNLNTGGYVKEKSTAGGDMLYEGVYKGTFIKHQAFEDNGFGPSIMGQFQISECIGGDDRAVGRKFTEFFNTGDDAASKKKGIAKLLNGFFSVGIDIDTSSDEALNASLDEQVGSAELFISLYKKATWKKEGEEFVKIDGEHKQGLTFLTEKNAEKQAKKYSKEDSPF